MKPKRKIELGDISDECKRRMMRCGIDTDNPCPYDKVCDAIAPKGFDGEKVLFPCQWDLTDPPRFTEAQMAFFRGCSSIGAKQIKFTATKFVLYDEADRAFADGYKTLPINGISDVTLDLAELFGKEGK